MRRCKWRDKQTGKNNGNFIGRTILSPGRVSPGWLFEESERASARSISSLSACQPPSGSWKFSSCASSRIAGRFCLRRIHEGGAWSGTVQVAGQTTPHEQHNHITVELDLDKRVQLLPHAVEHSMSYFEPEPERQQ